MDSPVKKRQTKTFCCKLDTFLLCFEAQKYSVNSFFEMMKINSIDSFRRYLELLFFFYVSLLFLFSFFLDIDILQKKSVANIYHLHIFLLHTESTTTAVKEIRSFLIGCLPRKYVLIISLWCCWSYSKLIHIFLTIFILD